jgi:hypothetical protein
MTATHYYRILTMTVPTDISPKTLDQVMKAGRGAIIEYREIGNGMMTVKVRTQMRGKLSPKVMNNILKAVRMIVPGADWDGVSYFHSAPAR